MHVGSGPRVVCQVPSRMVGIVVDHDGIGIPEPIGNVRIIELANGEIVSVEPESLAVAALKMKNVAGSESTRKAPVFKGTFHAEALVIAVEVVPHPIAITMD